MKDDAKDNPIDEATARFSRRLIADSTWVKLVNKMVENAQLIQKIQFKHVAKERLGELFFDKNTTYQFDYYDIGFEGSNSDGGWLTYQEIEYLNFPKVIDFGKNITQDLDQIEEILKSVDEFDFEKSDSNLIESFWGRYCEESLRILERPKF